MVGFYSALVVAKGGGLWFLGIGVDAWAIMFLPIKLSFVS
jgi:hypothetical protein